MTGRKILSQPSDLRWGRCILWTRISCAAT